MVHDEIDYLIEGDGEESFQSFINIFPDKGLITSVRYNGEQRTGH